MGWLGLIAAAALNVWAFPSNFAETNEGVKRIAFFGRPAGCEANSAVDAAIFSEHVNVVAADIKHAMKGNWNFAKSFWLWRFDRLGILPSSNRANVAWPNYAHPGPVAIFRFENYVGRFDSIKIFPLDLLKEHQATVSHLICRGLTKILDIDFAKNAVGVSPISTGGRKGNISRNHRQVGAALLHSDLSRAFFLNAES